MLREYYATINSLKDVEKDLLKNQLYSLKEKLTPGTESYNLNSLGINDFILTCTNEIKRFQDKKNKVEEKTRNIEDIISTIERAKILKDFNFEKIHKIQIKMKDYLSLHKFISYFESDMKTVVSSLSDKFLRIGETMLPQIAMAVFEKNDRKVREMRPYYQYWERRIYNALIKMIIKALLEFKQLLSRPKTKAIPLFKVQTEFVNPKVNTNPNFMEIKVTIEKFINSIIDSSNSFRRWKDGTCICVEPQSVKGGDEETSLHTYSRDIEKNKVITSIVAEISDIQNGAFDRLKKSKKTWQIEKSEDDETLLDTYRKGLWDPKHRSQIDKILEKNSSTYMIEFNLEMFDTLLKEY